MILEYETLEYDAMDRIKISGGISLKGKVRTQGAKNAALPVMASCLLLKGQKMVLNNVPNLQDVETMTELLTVLGVSVTREADNNNTVFRVPETVSWEAPESLVRKMRASSLVLGPLLARCGRAVLPLPGGCSIGSRPIDLHLKGLVQMGAKIEIKNGFVYAQAERLRGRRIYLDFPSVGATENLMMAAVFAKGETIIENTAREPEIENLAAVLRGMGVQVDTEGVGCIRVQGVSEVHGCSERVIPDRIEACTYLLAGVMTGGEVTVEDVIPEHVDALLAKLEEAGVSFSVEKNSIAVHPVNKLQPISLKTMPFPGFPTDLQPQMVAALTLSNGVSLVEESVFQARFLYSAELNRMGANIDIKGDTAIIKGVKNLSGASVKASDLRAGAALILAGLAAEGETRVENIEHVLRGYEAIDLKLRALGADVAFETDAQRS
ncbi:MAG: UDP-N-acetylglucosamine 1-carboxyvinyltransferase [Synergistaceae bacterium]|jgi:UDP-N-acetylglucosamine 1-carboxyvinyltransferase|nr:UDP-N-acetylglucosamine 1-carboxyvinyltransferase [Synergistaceae bacterium]